MFATKGRLKVALLVIRVLVVGLGMYAGFQMQEAEAHETGEHYPKQVTTTTPVVLQTTFLQANINATCRFDRGHSAYHERIAKLIRRDITHTQYKWDHEEDQYVVVYTILSAEWDTFSMWKEVCYTDDSHYWVCGDGGCDN